MDEYYDHNRTNLLLLKRYEQPPPGYFDNFLHEFHRRQRDELLRQPLWRSCVDRARDFAFSFNLSTLTSYPVAVTAVLVCAAVISLKIYQTPQPATLAVKDQQVLVVPASAEPEWTLASPAATRVFNTRSLRNMTESAQTHRSGIAMLKVDLASPTLPIGSSDQLEIATPVVAIGYPLDLAETPSFGMIGGFDRKCFGGYFSTKHLRVNLPPQRGEGGAPLLNLKGEVVGILLCTFENNSCYALPIEAAEKIRSDFVRFGEPRHGWIGANIAEASAAVEGSRAVTKEIMKDTPAAESGMKPGDVVLQIGRTKVHEPEDILDASFFLTAGDVVPITVMRGSEKLTFSVQADFHPASQPRPPLLAAPPLSNRAIPLNLQSAPERSP